MPTIWDEKLWDTYNPQLYNFTKYNQEFMKQYFEFLERRAKIEDKYSRDMKKLIKDFRPKEFDKKEKFKFSLQSSFDDMLNELNSSANQHDILREDLLKSAKEVKDSLKDLQRQTQQTEKKITGLNRDLDRSRSQLESVRQVYQRAFADMRKARDDYNANKDNKDITKNEEERFHQVYQQKLSQFEDRKNGYAKELTDYNSAQQRYYTELLPEQLSTLESQEQRLATFCQQQFQLWGDCELRALNISTICAQTLRDKANNVSAEADIREFLRVTASGNPVPADVPFEDLGSSDSISRAQPGGPNNARDSKKFNTLKQKSAPAQQKRRLEEQLKLKDDELDKAIKSVDAMQKLLQTYQQNPKLGDCAMVQQQMQQAIEQREQIGKDRAEILRELQQLGVDISNLSGPVAQAEAPQPARLQAVQPAGDGHNTSGASAFADEFADESPVSPAKSMPHQAASTATAPPPAPPVPGKPSLPVVAMLYEFNDPSQPDNLAAVAGERLLVVSRDTDWTLVRRTTGNTAEEGYVPTAYIVDV